MQRDSIKQFMIWFRNGVSFCTLWFLVLMLVRNYALGIENIKTDMLLKMILAIVGGVLVFCICFFPTVIKKWRFQKRLTMFILFFSVYECACFYWLGIFQQKGTLGQYGIFVGIVMASYFCCMNIYSRYSKKQGELYTQALQNYQKKIG